MSARGVFVAALFGALAARAQNTSLGFRMINDATNPFPYYIDGRSLSPVGNLTLSQIQSATDQAWTTWAQVSCNDNAFRSMGPSSNNANIVNPEDAFDAYNVSTIWLTSIQDPYYDYALSGGVLGAALPQAYGGILDNCDIYMNAVNYSWTMDGGPQGGNWADIESVVLHEVGHCQGLGHTSDINDVMYAWEPLGYIKRTLSTADVQAICAVSPKSGAVGSPCTGTPACMTAGLVCVRPPLPDGGTAAGMCTQGCAPTSSVIQCPSPYICQTSTLVSGSNGACLLPAAGYVTQVGKACTQMQDCGSSNGQCQQPILQNDGTFNAWDKGYCTQLCGTQFSPCPASSTCVPVDANNSICLKTCRPGAADCRENYACQPSGAGSGYCVPSCHADVDCTAPGGPWVCRTCDGLCLAQQTPTAQIGDTCTSQLNCGLGQVCLGFGMNPTSGICSQVCGSPCTACPNGSTCAPVDANGSLYCLLACPANVCPGNLRCTQSGVGPVCVQNACQVQNDCPVGDACVGGVCVNPYDAGSCPLCPQPDSGNGYTPGNPPDAGTPNGGTNGCGCGSGGAGVALALLAVLWAAMTRRFQRR